MTFLEELFGFVGFDEDDHRRLRELHPRIAPVFPAIVDRFYQAVLASPSAAAVLTGPAQVERMRGSLIDWMSSGLLGPYDERFYEKRSRIGRRHVAIGMSSYFMFTAMNVVRLAYQDRIVEAYPPDEAARMMRAVHKLLDCELAIMVQHYELDTQDKLVLRERRAQADRILAMQTMTAGLAHEVRNPLNAAKLQLELLERRLHRLSEDPRLLEPTELAQKEIERLTTLLNEFLVFARPPELHPLEHDVVAIVRQVVDLERVEVEKRGARLELTAEPAQLLAEVDAPKLHQLVLNLVRNAGEAVSTGGHVAVEVGVNDAHCHIRVEDDGPGIPDDVRPRIYEPFFSTKEGGTGLGMSIVHSLVSLHGGSIDLATGPQGTRFEVTLPRWQ
ncbi:MAG TPA: protoglobin domain-containing protein [Kofleriaceae bacterium]|nr:protoglobin domain-containing protein [Kofleriaceae bacterium]